LHLVVEVVEVIMLLEKQEDRVVELVIQEQVQQEIF